MARRNESYAEWSVVVRADNAVATASKAARVGFRHYITGVTTGYSAAPAAAKTITVKSGTTVLDQYDHVLAAASPAIVNYVQPLRCGRNEVAEVSVPASGTAGVFGTAVVKGYTIQE